MIGTAEMRSVAVWCALLVAVTMTAAGHPAINVAPHFAGECFTVHGRLFAANGNPGVRIWRIGTGRILGVHNCNGDFDSEDVVPANIRAVLRNGDSDIYGDYTVCPFRNDHPGRMRPVCIKRAMNLVPVKRR
jgi:hypothetical protein